MSANNSLSKKPLLYTIAKEQIRYVPPYEHLPEAGHFGNAV